MSDEEFVKKISIYDYVCAKQHICRDINCGSTKCVEKQINWLKSEHKEPIKLSDAERVILENINNDFEWICRDEDNTISVFTDEPSKMIDGSGFWCRVEGDFNNLECFNHLFQFIKWEDTEAYNIEELLKGK